MKMKTLEKIYLSVISEENYSDNNWTKHGSYRGIDFYIRVDGHLMRRLNERYADTSMDLATAFIIVKKFIKEELKNEKSVLSCSRSEFPFTIYGELSKMYVSGRFKMNKGNWRCYVATVLPPADAHHSSNDVFITVKA